MEGLRHGRIPAGSNSGERNSCVRVACALGQTNCQCSKGEQEQCVGMCNVFHQCYYHRPTSFDCLEDSSVESVRIPALSSPISPCLMTLHFIFIPKGSRRTFSKTCTHLQDYLRSSLATSSIPTRFLSLLAYLPTTATSMLEGTTANIDYIALGIPFSALSAHLLAHRLDARRHTVTNGTERVSVC